MSENGNRWDVDMLDMGSHSRNYSTTLFSETINLVATAAETCNCWAHISTTTAPELQDFVVELVHEIERLQTELLDMDNQLERISASSASDDRMFCTDSWSDIR